jgi:hypothetical protein
MSTIYELTDEILQLLHLAEEEDLDPQTLADTFEGLDGEFEIKCESYAKLMKELGGEADMLEDEAKRLLARAKTKRNNIDRMKLTLQDAMMATGKTKFKTPLFSFGIQKNPAALKIDDATKIPEQYLIPQEPKVDNAGIKAALKGGAEYDWCHLEQTEGLRIR